MLTNPDRNSGWRKRGVNILLSAVALAALLGAALPAFGQSYPSRPLRIVIGVLPGGTVDLLARLFATPLGAALGQPVVIENRPGAASRLAAELVAKSAPDGYTLLITSNTNSIVTAGASVDGNPLRYDLVRDFQPLTLLVYAPYALAVLSDSPLRTARDYLEAAKAKPEALSYGSSGVGAVDHLAGALFASMANVKLLHVPHRGMGPFMTSLLGNQIHSAFASLPALVPYVKDGKIRLLGVLGQKRVSQFPDVPTLAEATPLPGYDVSAWLGMVTVAGTPRSVVDRLNAELNRIAQDPQFARTQLLPRALEPAGTTPEQMLAVVKAEIPKYARIIRENGIKLE
jgi:tripartite-type tricarboxylate transporter receptor subunit TctC